MSVLEKAIQFAVKAHTGAYRKGSRLPYIVHPMEATTIAAALTDDPQVLAAVVLHDVVEDTKYTLCSIRRRFGERVASLVASNSENKRENQPAADTWKLRKQETLDRLKTATREEKIVVFADKLANLRSLHRDYLLLWEQVWERFNMKDPEEHLWYYGGVISLCEDFAGTDVYKEYLRLYGEIRSRVQEFKDTGAHGSHLKVIAAPGNRSWVLKDEMNDEVLVLNEEEFLGLLSESTPNP